MLTAKRLRQVLRYDPETGHFHRLGPTDKRHTDPAGCLRANSVNGYKAWWISVDGKQYNAARLAWLWVTGKWPDPEIDHWDRNSLNNRWDNLREATRSENMLNIGQRKDNTSGMAGVYHNKPWQATFRGKTIGHFWTKKEAFAAVVKARNEYGHTVRQPARVDDD